MKVAFLSPSLSRIAGGIFEIEREMALALDARPDTQVSAYGVIDRATHEDLASWRHIPVHLGKLVGLHGFGYSPELREQFKNADADIVHLHALWMYTSVLARDWKRRTGRPYVTTANGMLEPWALANARLKKRAAGFFYERAALREVACLHVNTDAERRSAEAFGVKGPFCIVPNGVTLPGDTVPDLSEAPEAAQAIHRNGGQALLFLGRLHPKKNVLETLNAFIAVAPHHPDWHFVIAGWGADDYVTTLKVRAAEAGMTDRVHFPGALYARKKQAMLAHSDAFVLASHSEGFPMAVLEAFAHMLPVIMTAQCNLQPGFDAGAATKVNVDAADIARVLDEVFAASRDDRRTMGRKGRALVERQFTWDMVAQQMRQVYGWLTDGGSMPPTIVR